MSIGRSEALPILTGLDRNSGLNGLSSSPILSMLTAYHNLANLRVSSCNQSSTSLWHAIIMGIDMDLFKDLGIVRLGSQQ